MSRRFKGSFLFLSLAAVASLSATMPYCSAADPLEGKGLFREPEKSRITLTKSEANDKLLELSKKSLELSQRFSTLVNRHLKSAGNYDTDAFRMADDDLSGLFEEMDSNYLDSRMIYYYLGIPEDALEAQKKALQLSKMMMYKSSAIFNLCFGRPLTAAQCARLALNLSQYSSTGKESEADTRFYLGTALTWAGDYKNAVEELQKAIASGKNKPYTQIKPGQPVNMNGQNPFAAHQLATALLANNEGAKSIGVLSSCRSSAPSPETQGVADALLAVAYASDSKTQKDPAKIKEHSALARKELADKNSQVYPGIADEWLGAVESLNGNYTGAEKLLSDAITKLQAAPLQAGNRLEAAQASLWRAHCRDKLGNAGGAAQDMESAMSLADEAPHLVTVSKMLDRVFGKNLSKQPGALPQEKWALVVGLGNYADPNIPRLRYPRKDAEDMAKFLKDYACFKPDHIKVLTDESATKENLMDNLGGSWLPAVSKPEDVVFLFISSHGTPAYQDIGALNSVVTYDTAINKLFTTSIPMQTIVRTLATRLNRRHIFVVLDSCYSGGLGVPFSKDALTNVEPELLLSSNYQLLVSSSNGNERSWESKRYPNSVFTRQMIDTIQTHRDYDRFQTIFPEIRTRVGEEVAADHTGVQQTPGLSGLWTGKGL